MNMMNDGKCTFGSKCWFNHDEVAVSKAKTTLKAKNSREDMFQAALARAKTAEATRDRMLMA